MNGLAWTDDLHAFASQRWLAGARGVDIADEIYNRFGATVSASAIIGRMRRRGVKHGDDNPMPRERPVRIPSAPRERRAVPTPRPPVVRPVRYLATVQCVEVPPPSGVPLTEAQACHCRWIDGSPRAALVCGQPVVVGASWCPDHWMRVHQSRTAMSLEPRSARAA